jgi:hypothetical protein
MNQALDNQDRKLTVICTPLLFRESRLPVELVLIFTAVLALLLGTAVYFLGRDWTHSMLLAPFVGYQWARFTIFGAIGGCLPSLLHAYAITVLIIIALRPWPRSRPWICLLWFILASFLEWLQSDTGSTWFVSDERIMGGSELMASLGNYALHGQFDVLDLIAPGMGCIAALAIATSLSPHR